MALLFLGIATLFFLYKNTPQTATPTSGQPATPAVYDSTALHLSLIPSHGTLPFYYAVRSRLADSSGINVVIHTTYAQPDTDTAIKRQRVDAAVLPLSYIAMSTAQANGHLIAIMSIPERWQLVSAKQLRAKAVDKLKGRLVATTRYAAGDLALRTALAQACMDYTQVYHPQINAIDVRQRMVSANQIDAAMLPTPWAEMAINDGCKSLWKDSTIGQQWALTIHRRTLNNKAKYQQLSQAIQLYNKAVVELNKPQNALRDTLYMELFRIKPEALSKLPRQQWAPAMGVREGDVKAAFDYLKACDIPATQTARTALFTHTLIAEE